MPEEDKIAKEGVAGVEEEIAGQGVVDIARQGVRGDAWESLQSKDGKARYLAKDDACEIRLGTEGDAMPDAGVARLSCTAEAGQRNASVASHGVWRQGKLRACWCEASH